VLCDRCREEIAVANDLDQADDIDRSGVARSASNFKTGALNRSGTSPTNGDNGLLQPPV
jgi:hypothetical protein